MDSITIIPKVLSLADLILVESRSPGKPVCTACFLITQDDRVFFGETVGQTIRELSLDHFDSSLEPVPDQCIFPLVPVDVKLKIAPDEVSSPVFIKRPGLDSYRQPDEDGYLPYDVPKDLLNEVLVMNKISSKGGHQNIVNFYGCRIYRGRITGIVLEKYEQTLLQCLESDPGAFSRLDLHTIMSGLEAAVAFLHGLGLAHNDISPHNVMLGKRNQPVLIDFGSCGTWGQRLQTVGTQGFSDEEFGISQERNDFFSLEKLREWIEKKQDESRQTALDT